jgi:hypothetical protein
MRIGTALHLWHLKCFTNSTDLLPNLVPKTERGFDLLPI